jgi:hypothetical protein
LKYFFNYLSYDHDANNSGPLSFSSAHSEALLFSQVPLSERGVYIKKVGQNVTSGSEETFLVSTAISKSRRML